MGRLVLAASYCDRIYVVDKGTIKSAGVPKELLQPALIGELFGVGSKVEHDPSIDKLRINFFLDGGIENRRSISNLEAFLICFLSLSTRNRESLEVFITASYHWRSPKS